jgi:hypothetical protein
VATHKDQRFTRNVVARLTRRLTERRVREPLAGRGLIPRTLSVFAGSDGA